MRALQAYDVQLKASGKPVRRRSANAPASTKPTPRCRAQSLANLSTPVKTLGDVYAVLPQPICPDTCFGWTDRKDADSATLVKFFSDGIVKPRRTASSRSCR